MLALQSLTIIPAGRGGEVSGRDLGRSTAFFPLVGAIQGGMLVGLALLLDGVFSRGLTNGLLILLLVVSNGGFHLDGLADTFDALASRGDRQRRLDIMKQGTTGAIGVTAIVLVILLRYLLLNELPKELYYTALSLMTVSGRWAVMPVIFHGRPARQEGIGRTLLDNTGLRELIVATVFALLITALVIAQTGYLRIFWVMPVLYVLGVSSARFFNRLLGGVTGDTLGAVSELSEVIYLLLLLLICR